MPKLIKTDIGEFYQHYPKVATIVTAHSKEKSNGMAVAWHTSISFRPPLYGVSISPRRFTYKLIQESGEFGVNFLPFEMAQLIAAVGGSKGEEMDKFQRFNIALDTPVKTKVPILKQAYAAYECRVVDSRTYGDHIWVVGEIVAVHLLEEAFTLKQILDLDKVTPTLYCGAELYVTTAKESLRFLDREIYGKGGKT